MDREISKRYNTSIKRITVESESAFLDQVEDRKKRLQVTTATFNLEMFTKPMKLGFFLSVRSKQNSCNKKR